MKMAEAATPPAEAAADPSSRTPGASSTYCVSFKPTHLDVVVKTPVLPSRGDNLKFGFPDGHDGAVLGEDGRKFGQKVRLLEEEQDDIVPAEG